MLKFTYCSCLLPDYRTCSVGVVQFEELSRPILTLFDEIIQCSFDLDSENIWTISHTPPHHQNLPHSPEEKTRDDLCNKSRICRASYHRCKNTHPSSMTLDPRRKVLHVALCKSFSALGSCGCDYLSWYLHTNSHALESWTAWWWQGRNLRHLTATKEV